MTGFFGNKVRYLNLEEAVKDIEEKVSETIKKRSSLRKFESVKVETTIDASENPVNHKGNRYYVLDINIMIEEKEE